MKSTVFKMLCNSFIGRKNSVFSVVTNGKMMRTNTNLSLFVVGVIRRKIIQFSLTNINFFIITSFLPFSPHLLSKKYNSGHFSFRIQKSKMVAGNLGRKQIVVSTDSLNPGLLRKDSSNFHFCCSLPQG